MPTSASSTNLECQPMPVLLVFDAHLFSYYQSWMSTCASITTLGCPPTRALPVLDAPPLPVLPALDAHLCIVFGSFPSDISPSYRWTMSERSYGISRILLWLARRNRCSFSSSSLLSVVHKNRARI